MQAIPNYATNQGFFGSQKKDFYPLFYSAPKKLL
jgi:hypothetical protein